MTSHSLKIIQGQSVVRGFRNLLSIEMRNWWGTKKWWIHLVIWMLTINGLFAISTSGITNMSVDEAIELYCIYSGVAALGVIIIAQGAVIGEIISGTAAWILSKPTSRLGFILSKMLGNLSGILITMVLVPGIIAYFQIYYGFGKSLSIQNYVYGMAIIALFLIFFHSLTLMLGTIFTNRNPIIGIAIGSAIVQDFLAVIPGVANYLPWTLLFSNDRCKISVVGAVMMNTKFEGPNPIFGTLTISIVFFIIAILSFKRKNL